MNYIENIYICLAAPLLIAVLCLRGTRRRMMIFFLAGMTACLVSSYISTFLAMIHAEDLVSASIEISPLVEESMKLFPVVFYLIVMEPKRRELVGIMLVVAVAFATFENVCYLTDTGSEQLSHLLIRGFGTGAMHVVTGMIVAIGLYYLWDRLYLRFAGTAGLLSLAVTFHAIYNLLISQGGNIARIGFVLPVLTVLVVLILGRDLINKLAD